MSGCGISMHSVPSSMLALATPGSLQIMNLSLILGLLSLAVWIVGTFLHPVGAGWIHLLLAAGVILLIRRVVTGRAAW